ncbi:D-alanyl-D-alanine carboxypeptidase family protein [Pseudonocardia sp. HH130629-09]|uniref:D-alanyl-D-alanine carboxypeptidase family protein n=1 Tax=Pseudonocardia sp. HH130629-09 TaxID=1641402 RepID=UPI001EE75B57|nr:serine hydrolase [Pseudonocardia sp. HH130629-09]
MPLLVVLTLLGHPGTAAAGVPGAAPVAAPAGCPGQDAPPGPPAREEAVPVAPLPVPSPAVGGLDGCGDAHAGPVPPPPVGVASYVVADLDSGAVLAARAPHTREHPASTIKLLLALVVDERLPMDRVVVGTTEDANVDGSRAGIGPGGRYTVDQLLHGLLLSSGNDAANALARELGGVPATLAAMREEAADLGALDTRPATPAGLDGPGMSSSAYDLNLLLRAALERPRIAAALTTRNIPFPGFADKPGFLLGNDDRLLGTPGFLGGKNGFTDAARHTFVGAMERDGRRLVVAVVRGEQRPVRMVDQARALLDWGFGAPATGIGTLVEPGTTGSADGSGTPPAPRPPQAPPTARHRRPEARTGRRGAPTRRRRPTPRIPRAPRRFRPRCWSAGSPRSPASGHWRPRGCAGVVDPGADADRADARTTPATWGLSSTHRSPGGRSSGPAQNPLWPASPPPRAGRGTRGRLMRTRLPGKRVRRAPSPQAPRTAAPRTTATVPQAAPCPGQGRTR